MLNNLIDLKLAQAGVKTQPREPEDFMPARYRKPPKKKKKVSVQDANAMANTIKAAFGFKDKVL